MCHALVFQGSTEALPPTSEYVVCGPVRGAATWAFQGPFTHCLAVKWRAYLGLYPMWDISLSPFRTVCSPYLWVNNWLTWGFLYHTHSPGIAGGSFAYTKVDQGDETFHPTVYLSLPVGIPAAPLPLQDQGPVVLKYHALFSRTPPAQWIIMETVALHCIFLIHVQRG